MSDSTDSGTVSIRQASEAAPSVLTEAEKSGFQIKPQRKGALPDQSLALQYLERWIMASSAKRKGALHSPTLDASLQRLDLLPQTKECLLGLPRRPFCLIEGYICPRNAAALRTFLRHHGLGRCHIHTVDLYDLPQLYRKLGIRMPKMHFTRADASDLHGQFQEGEVQLVIQDFLLNCAPHPKRQAILDEASRILCPGGLALLSYTDSSGLADRTKWNKIALAEKLDLRWDSMACDLTGLAGGAGLEPSTVESLLGTVVETPEWEGCSFIAPPIGRFEFFVEEAVMRRAFAKAGFELVAEDRSEGLDYAGIRCRRHRCLLRRAARADEKTTEIA